MQKLELPIFEIESQLLESADCAEAPVLTAPTGSGKSTQVPQMLLDDGLLGDGQVTVLQPRRLPTRMLAKWVAQTRGVKLGGAVGYQMRLDNVTSPATRICYATEGVLLRHMLADPELKGVSAILFDEFHERHLYGDITLARALEIQESTRPDLIIVVMSATLDVATVQKYLHPCALLSSEGRTHPVAIEYLAKPAGDAPVWDLAVNELQRLVQHPAMRCSCPVMKRARCRQRAVRSARSSWCFHCTANWRPEIRTRRWPAMSGAKSSSPPTSRKPRSPSTVFAW
jgi:ATP-dependent helicase HrpB